MSNSIQQITAVGDPLQTLYDWRGASPNNFDQLLSWSKNSQVFHFLDNFRSGQQIIDYINSSIPSLEQCLLSCTRPDINATVQHSSSLKEALNVLRSQGLKSNEMTILSYKRSSCQYVQKELAKLAEFTSHDLLKKRGLCRFLAFLYLAFEPNDSPSHCRLTSSKELILDTKQLSELFRQTYFSSELQAINNTTLDKKSLLKALHKLCKNDDLIKTDQWLCKRFLSYLNYQRACHRKEIDVLNQFSLNELFPPESTKKILISTIHQFKGRQSKAVILYKDFKVQNPAEERLYYVALSRAEKQLIIIDKL